MKFRVYLPESNSKLPILYFLSGLTCNYDNFITKSGAIPFASNHKIALICPDTSPRGCNIEGEGDEWDFGLGAGYYVDATTELWKKNYNMYSYVTEELPKLIVSQLPLDETRQSIFGHSMGGHGALVCYLNNPGKYLSCSAFAPICHPTKEGAGWGPKAFKRFLGEDQSTWKKYDASLLLKSYKGEKVEILCDQGDEDNFNENLNAQSLIDAAKENDYPLNFRFQKGYDHSYYFIATFIEDHLDFHAKYLNKK